MAAAIPSDGLVPGSSTGAGDTQLVAWKSYIGVSLAQEKRLLRSKAKGWGNSGAVSDALITRHGDIEGFSAVVPTATVSLFIGFTNLKGSLSENARAHQEDLEFAIRISSDGAISYSSRARLMQYAYAAHVESEAIGDALPGDAVGMRLTPDRNGFCIFKVERAASGDNGEGRRRHSSSRSSSSRLVCAHRRALWPRAWCLCLRARATAQAVVA